LNQALVTWQREEDQKKSEKKKRKKKKKKIEKCAQLTADENGSTTSKTITAARMWHILQSSQP